MYILVLFCIHNVSKIPKHIVLHVQTTSYAAVKFAVSCISSVFNIKAMQYLSLTTSLGLLG